jgi:hypothetical protein
VDIRRRTFATEAIKRLDFLRDEHGFVGPQLDGDADAFPLLLRISYHRKDLAVEASLVLDYGGEEYVTVELLHNDDPSGVARRTQVATGPAHTGYQMRRALDGQAQAVRDLISRDVRVPSKPPGIRATYS